MSVLLRHRENVACYRLPNRENATWFNKIKTASMTTSLLQAAGHCRWPWRNMPIVGSEGNGDCI